MNFKLFVSCFFYLNAYVFLCQKYIVSRISVIVPANSTTVLCLRYISTPELGIMYNSTTILKVKILENPINIRNLTTKSRGLSKQLQICDFSDSRIVSPNDDLFEVNSFLIAITNSFKDSWLKKAKNNPELCQQQRVANHDYEYKMRYPYFMCELLEFVPR